MTTFCTAHAQARAKQRYKVDAENRLHEDLLWRIRTGDGLLRKRYRGSSQRWICTVRHQRRTWRVVVNRSMNAIITFLPAKKNQRRNARS